MGRRISIISSIREFRMLTFPLLFWTISNIAYKGEEPNEPFLVKWGELTAGRVILSDNKKFFSGRACQ